MGAERKINFTSLIPPKWSRRTKSLDALLPVLYHLEPYTTAALLASPREAKDTGASAELSDLTGLKTFVTSFAGHIAAEAARTR